MNKKEEERLLFCILVQKPAFSGTDFLQVLKIETVLEGSSFHPRGSRAFCACAFAQLERKAIYPISSKLFEMICTMQTFSFTIISN